MKLLVVDDSFSMRKIIKNTLKLLGYDDVLEAENGIKAWDILINNSDIKIIITDWNMPEMNGLELVKKIRSLAIYDDIPIIMVTTEGGETEIITALKAGVDNYVTKPFTPQILKEKIKYVLDDL